MILGVMAQPCGDAGGHLRRRQAGMRRTKRPARDRLSADVRLCYNSTTMTATELKRHWHAAPFVPFKIVLPSGEKVPVPHPDFLTVSPSGRIAGVWKKGDQSVSFEVFRITAVETARRASRSKRK